MRFPRFCAYLPLLIPLIALLCFAETTTDQTTLNEFIQQMGGTIPYPPEKILQILNSQGKSINGVVFPHGRSLERDNTDYDTPRSLFSYTPDPERPNALIALAYTPGNHQLQIIATNNQTHQMDFRIVKNYAEGQIPTLQSPQPHQGVCLACHQNGGLLFPVSPWSETTGSLLSPNPDLVEKLLNPPNGKPADPFAKILLSKKYGSNSPEVFDFQTRLANKHMVSKQFCSSVCQGDRTCEQGIVISYLLFQNQDISTPDALGKARISRFFGNIIKRNDFQNYIRPSDAIGNRTPTFDGRDITPGETLGLRNDPIAKSQFDNLIFSQNAKTGGINPNELVLSLGQCFDWSNVKKDAFFKKFSKPGQILNLIDSPAITNLTAKWPLSEEELFDGIMSDSSTVSTEACATTQTSTPEAPSPIPDFMKFYRLIDPAQRNRPNSSTPLKKPAELFTMYCAACHMGKDSVAPTLPLNDPAAMKAYIGTAGRTVEQMIKGPDYLMPPAESFFPELRERQSMINSIH